MNNLGLEELSLSRYYSAMKRASITEAKNRLSALLDQVRRGESVLIEDRGVAIAQLNPVSAAADAGDTDRIARLERQGILRPLLSPEAPVLLLEPPPRPKQPIALSRLVAAEREEGW